MKKVCMFLLFISSFPAYAAAQDWHSQQCRNGGYKFMPNTTLDSYTARVIFANGKHTFLTTPAGSVFKIQPSSNATDETHQTELMEKVAFSAYASQTKVDLCVTTADSPWRIISITSK